MKKLFLMLVLISFIFITGCDEEKKENIKYNEYEVLSDDSMLKEGFFLSEKIYNFSEEESLKNTNFKLMIKAETSNPFTYTVRCNKFDSTNNYCSESEEILNINDTKITVNNNKYSLQNINSNTEEKFLTYLQIINEYYLMVITDSNKYFENGNLIIFDFLGNKMFEEKYIASSYYIEPTDTNGEVHMDNVLPIVEAKTLVYYTCNKESKKVFKYNLSLENFDNKVIEVIDAKCHIDNFND